MSISNEELLKLIKEAKRKSDKLPHIRNKKEVKSKIIDQDSYSAEEVFGDWLKSPAMRVAKALKGARAREGLTQKEICDKLNIQQSNYSSMERGERPIPKSLITKLAKLLNINAVLLDSDKVEKKLNLKKGKTNKK